MNNAASGQNARTAQDYPHLQAVLDFAQGVYAKEKEELRKENETGSFMPGQATAFRAVELIEKELRRKKEMARQQEPCGLDRATLESALRPFYSLAMILRNAGHAEISGYDMADVLTALAHSAWARTGHPSTGEAL